jgi:hypothetical protein
MELLIARQARLLEQTLKDKLTELERNISRMERERDAIKSKLIHYDMVRMHGDKQKLVPLVSCLKCGRDRDFLTDNGGYLAHVLEDPQDVEALEPGKPLFCPGCGDVFLFERLTAVKRKK